jgi:P4 family phage/plasmid primase-like protien
LSNVPATGRGGLLDVAAVGTLVADLDWYAPGAHADETLVSEAFVRAAVASLGELAPSIVVCSGYGLQCYWLLDEPVDVELGAELQDRVSARLLEAGVSNDRTDLASVLRLPGSRNVKLADPRPVTVETFEPGRRFVPEWLGKYLPAATAVRRSSSAGTRHSVDGVTPGQLALLEHIVERYGAHSPIRSGRGEIHVTRPGKDARQGSSASIIVGAQGDAVLTVFSPSWISLGPLELGSWQSWVLVDGELRHAHAVDPIISMIDGADDADPIVRNIPTPERRPAPDIDTLLGKHGLRVVNLVRGIEARWPLAVDAGGRVYAYIDGLWHVGGERIVRHLTYQWLGNRARQGHVANALDMLAGYEPTISHEQPEALLNVPNGMLEWRTGRLLPHGPEHRSTYQLRAEWQPGATCPTVDRWLAEVVEADVVDLVWEVIGMCAYAGDPFHRAVLLHGTGRNGKGTLLRLITALIGAPFVSSITPQQLAEDRFAAAGLFGMVANLAGDLDARAVLRSDVFKMATGGDRFDVQRKYGQPFQMVNRATMLFAANTLPGSPDHSHGYSARWVVVPFQSITLRPEQEDKTLEARMARELAGVLVKAVAGLRRALDRGDYLRPPSVVEATEAFRRDSDPLARFVDECLEVTGMPHHDVARAAVVDAYRAWCRQEGITRPIAVNRFWRELQELEPRIDTGTTAGNPNGHRVNKVPVVKGIERIEHPGFGL